jgi:dihydrofolate reductase
MKQRLSLIAAVGENRAIGRNNGLIWQFREDMRQFRHLTIPHAIIMGRNTALSLPNPLPNRKNIVLTRVHHNMTGFAISHSIDDALRLAKHDDEVFFIGGASIYAQAIPLVSRMYLTEVRHAPKDADTFFPEFDRGEWSETSRESHDENGFRFDFVVYDRIIR